MYPASWALGLLLVHLYLPLANGISRSSRMLLSHAQWEGKASQGNRTLQALQALANDIAYDRVDRRTMQQSLFSEGSTISKDPDVVPRTLIIDGCSGSSYLVTLSSKLLKAHGVSAHPVGDAGSHKEAIRHNLKFYSTEEEIKAISDAKIIDALGIANDIVNKRGEALLFKTNIKLNMWEPSFEEFSAYLKSNVKSALVLRHNLLDWNICRVRDCFDKGHQGRPVNKKGEPHEACLKRRHDPSIESLAYIFAHKMGRKIKNDAVTRDETVQQLKEAGLVTEVVHSEDLLDFEHEDASGLDNSIKAWAMVLEAWAVEPDEEIIKSVLEKEELAGKLPQPGPHSEVIFNFENVSKVLGKHGMAHYLRE